ncbi:MAG: pseudouridine synthase [Bdellovibrionales bacterium]
MPWKKTETGVVHFISTESGLWSHLVARETDMDQNSLMKVAELGGVYLNNCRIFQEHEVRANDYLRLHTDPRRYSIESLKNSVVWESDDLFVLDKPAGLPCHPTVDNAQENLLKAAQDQFHQSLYLTHRLDVPTSGLLVLAKSAKAQAQFHEVLKQRLIQKIYEAEVEPPGPELGLYEHHMVKSRYAPKVMQAKPSELTQVCQLRVLDKQSLGLSELLRLELLTGRTHQIRAQLAFLGFPILGDEMYRNPSDQKPAEEKFYLRCVELHFPWKSETVHLKIPGGKAPPDSARASLSTDRP